MASFSDIEWQMINSTLAQCLTEEREPFGLPEKRDKSVLLGTFNIRELGSLKNGLHKLGTFYKWSASDSTC